MLCMPNNIPSFCVIYEYFSHHCVYYQQIIIIIIDIVIFLCERIDAEGVPTGGCGKRKPKTWSMVNGRRMRWSRRAGELEKFECDAPAVYYFLGCPSPGTNIRQQPDEFAEWKWRKYGGKHLL